MAKKPKTIEDLIEHIRDDLDMLEDLVNELQDNQSDEDDFD